MIEAVDRVTGSLPLNPVSMCKRVHLNRPSVPLPSPPWQMWNLTLSEFWSWPTHWIWPQRVHEGEWDVFPIKPSLWVCEIQLCMFLCLFLYRGLCNHVFICSYVSAFRCGCVSVCVGVHWFNSHVCSRGALECLSTQGAKEMAWQVCVEDLVVCRTAAGSSTMCLFRPGRRQPRYRRTPVRRGRSSGGMSTFHCDYRERHNYDCTNTVMGCVTPRWVAVSRYVTDLGCLQFLL